MNKEQAVKLYSCLCRYFTTTAESLSSHFYNLFGIDYFVFNNVTIGLKKDKFCFDYYISLTYIPNSTKLCSTTYEYRSIEAFNYDVFVDDLNFFNLPWVSRIGLLGDLAK